MSQVPPALGELLGQRQKLILVWSLLLVIFIASLDASIVATATPHILADLGGFKQLSWVFTIYLLASTTVVPIAGKLSDMFGRKPFILAGLAIFLAASAACGAAPSMPLLIAARGAQGLGGGILMGCILTVIGDLFPPLERAKYMAMLMGAWTIAAMLGPTIGGFLTDGPGWRWCFYINLPIGALAGAMVSINLPHRSAGGRLASIDFLGAALLATATSAILLGLVWSNQAYGWTAPETIGLFAVSAVLLVCFVAQERRHPQAILPVHLFRNRAFIQINLLVAIQGAALFGAVQYLPTFVQTALGASATSSGLISTPQSVGVLVASALGGHLVSRTGRFKLQVIGGSSLMLVAALLLHTLSADVAKWHIVVFMALLGLGGGLLGPTLSIVVQCCVPSDMLGVATSARQFFNQIGQVLGVAVFGLVFTTVYASSFASGVPADGRAAIPAETLAQFHDPTLALDPSRYGAVRDEILALPQGRQLLQETTTAQRDAVATAIDRLFLGSSCAAVVVLALALLLKEIPLDRSRDPSSVAEQHPHAEMPLLEH